MTSATPAGTRALGWDTAEGGVGAGRYLSDKAYGHTGYTGTSIWIDPDRDMFVVLLTNRVHASRARHGIAPQGMEDCCQPVRLTRHPL